MRSHHEQRGQGHEVCLSLHALLLSSQPVVGDTCSIRLLLVLSAQGLNHEKLCKLSSCVRSPDVK